MMNNRQNQSIICLILIAALGLILSTNARAQDRRFGVDNSTPKDAPPAKDQDNNRRYLPTESEPEYNRRFGVGPGESALEIAPAPIVQHQETLVSKGAQLVAQGQLTRAIK